MEPLSKIRLEATNSCQLKCTACPTASGEIRPVLGQQHLQYGDFIKLLGINPWIKDIELSNYGEIFLNPELADIIAFAAFKGVSLHADNGVNFNFATESVLKAMAKFNNFKSMRVSIDGATAATDAKYRVGGDLHNVIRNIMRLQEYKRNARSQYPELTMQFILFEHNAKELYSAKLLAQNLGMKFMYKINWDEGLAPKPETLVQIDLSPDAGSREAYRKTHHEAYLSNICHQIWEEPVFNSDGKNLGCCRQFWGTFDGNAFEQSILEIMFNDKMYYARKLLRGEEIPLKQQPKLREIPCLTCDLYISRKEDKNWVNLPEPMV